MLSSLSQLLVITFSQTAVANIYFGGYFICSLQTKAINHSLFRPNQYEKFASRIDFRKTGINVHFLVEIL